MFTVCPAVSSGCIPKYMWLYKKYEVFSYDYDLSSCIYYLRLETNV